NSTMLGGGLSGSAGSGHRESTYRATIVRCSWPSLAGSWRLRRESVFVSEYQVEISFVNSQPNKSLGWVFSTNLEYCEYSERPTAISPVPGPEQCPSLTVSGV